MPCFYPIQAYYGERKANGKHCVVFKESEKVLSLDLKLPCGQCSGCRLERSRKWAMRLMFENQMHDSSCFITLTIDDDHMPIDRSICVDDFQSFIKRLRKRFVPKCPYKKGDPMRDDWIKANGIRFFHCGEYGESCRNCKKSEMFCRCSVFVLDVGRPHYHAILFGVDFSKPFMDKKGDVNVVEKIKYKNGKWLYSSSFLSDLWPFGICSVGDVTFESCAYVARYIMKKLNGKLADDVDDVTGLRHYELVDSNTGELFDRKPEYITMSRKPGIGSEWFDKYAMSDVYPKDYVTVRGRKMRPPSYFDRKLNSIFPNVYSDLKIRRESEMYNNNEDNTPERLVVREKCQLAKLNLLKRELE